MHHAATARDRTLFEALLAAAPALLTAALVVAYLLFGSGAKAGLL